MLSELCTSRLGRSHQEPKQHSDATQIRYDSSHHRGGVLGEQEIRRKGYSSEVGGRAEDWSVNTAAVAPQLQPRRQGSLSICSYGATGVLGASGGGSSVCKDSATCSHTRQVFRTVHRHAEKQSGETPETHGRSALNSLKFLVR